MNTFKDICNDLMSNAQDLYSNLHDMSENLSVLENAIEKADFLVQICAGKQIINVSNRFFHKGNRLNQIATAAHSVLSEDDRRYLKEIEDFMFTLFYKDAILLINNELT